MLLCEYLLIIEDYCKQTRSFDSDYIVCLTAFAIVFVFLLYFFVNDCFRNYGIKDYFTLLYIGISSISSSFLTQSVIIGQSVLYVILKRAHAHVSCNVVDFWMFQNFN